MAFSAIRTTVSNFFDHTVAELTPSQFSLDTWVDYLQSQNYSKQCAAIKALDYLLSLNPNAIDERLKSSLPILMLMSRKLADDSLLSLPLNLETMIARSLLPGRF